MTMDRFSATHSSTAADAIAHYEAAVQALAAHRSGAGEALDAAVAADPDLVCAHALRGFCYIVLARAELWAPARHQLARARAALERASRPSASERVLVAALAVACEGRLLGAAGVLEAHTAIMPRDFLAMKLAQTLRFMGGDLRGMLALTEAVLPAWSDEHVGSGFVYGCHAFGLEEAGRHREAEALGHRARALEPADAWGLHAVAHVHEVQGRLAEGIAWLDDTRPDWSACNNFAFHVAWHLALLHIEAGAFDAALEVYDADVRPVPTDDYRDVSNATSMLWRLGQFGVPVGRRWEELADIAKRRAGDTSLVFAMLFQLLGALGSKDRATAARVVASIEDLATQEGEQALVARTVGVGLARALTGLADGARSDLARLARSLPRIGGSHAQRDVFLRSLALIAADHGETAAFGQIVGLRGTFRASDRLSRAAATRLALACDRSSAPRFVA